MRKVNLSVLLDDETRAQLKEVLLGEAKAIARNEVSALVERTVREAVASKVGQVSQSNFQGLVINALQALLQTEWSQIHRGIAHAVDEETKRVVAKKLADKTVWEATGQEQYVKKVARESFLELLKAFGGGQG